MPQSLEDASQAPAVTKDAIRLALNSAMGMRKTWVVVEAEDDVYVYSKFMRSDSTTVKTSVSDKGRKGHANVEIIVKEINEEVPSAHIFGIRDADYSKFVDGFEVPANIFLTDHRDLEMMMLDSESVRKSLQEWCAGFEQAFQNCIPICRFFGYLRICNDVLGLSCHFHDKLRITKFWCFPQQKLAEDWKEACANAFLSVVDGCFSRAELEAFIEEKSLEKESLYDVCRGHDCLQLLPLMLINVSQYSAPQILLNMKNAYSFADFKKTRIYASIKQWQKSEGVEALLA